jgi:hypothetical protein
MKAVMMLLVIGIALPVWAQGTDTAKETAKPPTRGISSVAPLRAPRGSTITLIGTLPPESTFYIPERATVLNGRSYDCSKNPPPVETIIPAIVTSAPTAENRNVTTFSALVPASLPIGDYPLCANYTDGTTSARWYTVPVLGASGRLQVIEATGGPTLEVSAVPRVVYENDGRYKFSVLGSGFGRFGVDNEVLFNESVIPICWDNDAQCLNDATANRVGRAIARSTHQLELDLPAAFKDRFVGSGKVQVRVGGGATSAPNDERKITLAQISRDGPHWYAAIFIGVVIVLILVLLGRNKSKHTIDGVPVSMLASLLLDKNTDTFSLSRVQFYLWTVVAIYGYVYLTAAWTLLQGRLEFAPVPENMPGIIAASAGTAVVVEGISSSKPKGAGSVRPGVSDLITSGGMVVPERLQFLLWTIVGIFTFMGLIFASDPAIIERLPAIPAGFLTLMGISSAGYLGGRLVRKGGPVIDDVIARLGSLTFEIHGRYLSANASFQIDGDDVKLDQIAEGKDGKHLPEVLASDEQAQDATTAKVLKVSIAKPDAKWLTRKSNPSAPKQKHLLAIINPDGQKAEWPFSLAGPTALFSAKVAGKTLEGDPLKVTPNDVVTFESDSRDAKDLTWKIDGKPHALKSTRIQAPAFPAGLHTVTLEVVDAEGNSDSMTVNIESK